jgi:hypothetical protein
LEQRFNEIRRWSPKDVDLERNIWLRTYRIPAHAWNGAFFAKLTKPRGVFLNSDDGTNKKMTMDVARIMIRTSCQYVVDEFIDVNINDVVFHLRVIEDSYGPMRIMIPHPRDQDRRNNDNDNSKEEEEEVGRLLEVVDVAERESEGGGERIYCH